MTVYSDWLRSAVQSCTLSSKHSVCKVDFIDVSDCDFDWIIQFVEPDVDQTTSPMAGAIDSTTHYTQAVEWNSSPSLSLCSSRSLRRCLSSFYHTPAERAGFSCCAMRCSTIERLRVVLSFFSGISSRTWQKQTRMHGAHSPLHMCCIIVTRWGGHCEIEA